MPDVAIYAEGGKEKKRKKRANDTSPRDYRATLRYARNDGAERNKQQLFFSVIARRAMPDVAISTKHNVKSETKENENRQTKENGKRAKSNFGEIKPKKLLKYKNRERINLFNVRKKCDYL